jgi:hypothetical protein
MITHWETLKHAGLSILGMITLTNAFVAMFYTTASDSLVSPHLKYGDWNNQVMYGMVKTVYANPAYVASVCQNPTAPLDPEYASTTCLSILHAGQGASTGLPTYQFVLTFAQRTVTTSPSLVIGQRLGRRVKGQQQI